MIVVGLCVGSYFYYKNTYVFELMLACASPLEIIAIFETCRQAFLLEGSTGFKCIADAKTV